MGLPLEFRPIRGDVGWVVVDLVVWRSRVSVPLSISAECPKHQRKAGSHSLDLNRRVSLGVRVARDIDQLCLFAVDRTASGVGRTMIKRASRLSPVPAASIVVPESLHFSAPSHAEPLATPFVFDDENANPVRNLAIDDHEWK